MEREGETTREGERDLSWEKRGWLPERVWSRSCESPSGRSAACDRGTRTRYFFFFFSSFISTLVTGPRRSLGLKLSDFQHSTSLKHEPTSEPLHIYVKWYKHVHVQSRSFESPSGQTASCDRGTRKRYRGTSIRRNNAPLGTYSRSMPRALWLREPVWANRLLRSGYQKTLLLLFLRYSRYRS